MPQSQNPKMSRAKHWCFTLNNWTAEDVAALQHASETTVYLVFGRETGESGTPHLQGFVIFPAAVRLQTCKNRLGSDRFHVEVARGSPAQAATYCKKDGDFEEYGECPVQSQGRRSDLEAYYAWADAFYLENHRPPTTPEVARSEHVVVLTRYPGITALSRVRVELFPRTESDELREWQQRLDDRLAVEPDDRKIIFVVDETGNTGKSFFVKYYLDKHPLSAQFLSIGKRDDIAHAVKTHNRVFLFDIPRLNLQYLQFPVLEQMKNGLLMSPKYHSTVKRFSSKVHIVIFTNEHPDDVQPNVLSEDRYEFFNIN